MKNINEVPSGKQYIVQRYLAEPFLIDRLKFDFRLYVLMTSCSPLRLFLYNDGLSRFSTEPYELPENQNISDIYMHLTNYSINKHNENFIQGNYSSTGETGHKRSIKAVFKLLQNQGINTHRI